MYEQSSSSSAAVNGVSADAARSSDRRRTTSTSSSSSTTLYEVQLHRGSRGFGFAIRGGREFAGMPICVHSIASGGSAEMDGRLRVSATSSSSRSEVFICSARDILSP